MGGNNGKLLFLNSFTCPSIVSTKQFGKNFFFVFSALGKLE